MTIMSKTFLIILDYLENFTSKNANYLTVQINLYIQHTELIETH